MKKKQEKESCSQKCRQNSGSGRQGSVDDEKIGGGGQGVKGKWGTI